MLGAKISASPVTCLSVVYCSRIFTLKWILLKFLNCSPDYKLDMDLRPCKSIYKPRKHNIIVPKFFLENLMAKKVFQYIVNHKNLSEKHLF